MTALDTLLSSTHHPEIELRPEPGRWASLLHEFSGKRPAHAVEFRRELGLPTDRPVVMTGHQAQVWHPGILSKYLAADELVTRAGAAAVWVVVDQDANAPGVVRLPVRRGGAGGAARGLRVETWVIDPAGTRASGDVPTSRQLALKVEPAPVLEAGEVWAAAGVAAGIEAVRAALRRHEGAASAAGQVATAVGEMMNAVMHRGTALPPAPSLWEGEPRQPSPQPPPSGRGSLVMGSAISRTSLFASVVERMRSDPGACVRAYNAAARAHPHERVQVLPEDEVPLWAIGAEMGAVRRRVRVADLMTLPVERLAPRALLMTGLLRCAGCDLFIHGTGGGGGGERGGHAGYDRITEQWLESWMGHAMTLAPSVVATATLRLRIDNSGPGAEELRRAQWLAHRAMHEPGVLGDAAADASKRALVDRIRALKRSGGDARAAYREMHALLGRTRETHADGLRELRAAADAAAGRLGDAEIAADRTWAFPLYEAGQLAELRRMVAGAFG